MFQSDTVCFNLTWHAYIQDTLQWGIESHLLYKIDHFGTCFIICESLTWRDTSTLNSFTFKRQASILHVMFQSDTLCFNLTFYVSIWHGMFQSDTVCFNLTWLAYIQDTLLWGIESHLLYKIYHFGTCFIIFESLTWRDT